MIYLHLFSKTNTFLYPPTVWVECAYIYRDGMFNPDRLLVNNTGDFQAMSDAVFYNALAWVLTGSSKYSANAAYFIETWFINPATYQTPNLQYAQMERGPKGQIGDHTGLLYVPLSLIFGRHVDEDVGTVISNRWQKSPLQSSFCGKVRVPIGQANSTARW